MAQVTLPNSIDPATPATASEVQDNFVALRNTINGDLEGGVSGNLKADGVTAREIQNDVIWGHGPSLGMQAGVYAAGDFKVTPGAGLVLNYAAGTALIADPGGIVSGTGHLIPVFLGAGGSVSAPANASGFPRIDRVLLTLTGYGSGGATVSVLPGTPTAGATIGNLAGAAALPSGTLQIANVLTPAGFAGPYVQNTHIRDRRSWARGFFRAVNINAGADLNFTSAAFAAIDSDLNIRGEFVAGNPILLMLTGEFSVGAGSVRFAVGDGAAGTGFATNSNSFGSGDISRNPLNWSAWATASGNHLLVPSYAMVAAGNWNLYRAAVGGATPSPMFLVQEFVRQNSDNAGA